MKIDTHFLTRCIQALEKAMDKLSQVEESSIEYDIYRSAIIKEFEIILEQCSKLLKKKLVPFFHTHKSVDKLSFKDIFRHAGNHGLLNANEIERWFQYRDNRNETAHDYGIELAEQTLPLISQFIKDAKNVVKVIENDT